MKRTPICLGVFFLALAALSCYAQQENAGTSPASPSTQESQNSGSSAAENPSKTGTAKKDTDKERKYHIKMGTISLGVGYFSGTPFLNPYFYPYSYPYFYPFGFFPLSSFDGPYWAYPSDYFGYTSGRGELKLKGAPKKAAVFLDGAYAGTVDHLKEIWLDPGAYTLQVMGADNSQFEQRVYILSRKSVEIEAKLAQKKTEIEPQEAPAGTKPEPKQEQEQN
ncbi:MAG TPA: hypothetical protein VKZ53_02475 [Candidatus Angelobacter sp.]|nr:hypothetical protein [Candidatus Angelobacter sp.]